MQRQRPLTGALPVMLLLCLLAPAASAWASDNVMVVVNNSLYSGGQITSSLNTYLDDLREQGLSPILVTDSFTTPTQLRARLANQYSTGGLAGAVLIGSLPVEHFERNGQYYNPVWYERFAADLYYTDLDGTWSDATGNGTLDAHAGNVAPEIWLGRMTTAPLTGLHAGSTQESLLNDYLAKNHAYRTGGLTRPPKSLAYIDDDWASFASSWGSALAMSVTGQHVIVSSTNVTTAANYRTQLQVPREGLLLGAHSNATFHRFTSSQGYSYLDVTELAGVNPQALFYNLYACSGAAYETTNYMAGEYVFGNTTGLLAIGSAKTGGMLDYDPFYEPIGQGATYGEGLLNWFQEELGYGTGTYQMDWFYGMTLIGDPMLVGQAFIPEPALLSLLAAGVICLRRRKCIDH